MQPLQKMIQMKSILKKQELSCMLGFPTHAGYIIQKDSQLLLHPNQLDYFVVISCQERFEAFNLSQLLITIWCISIYDVFSTVLIGSIAFAKTLDLIRI